MKSLFNVNDNIEIINRINLLTGNSKPQWGKMDVSQMVAHCQSPLNVALGNLKLKRNLIGILFGGMAKKQLLKPGPFKRGLPTAPEFIIRDARNFSLEKEKLISLVTQFQKVSPLGLPGETHPFFGKLTVQEWDTLQWKHLDHHLGQFGV